MNSTSAEFVKAYQIRNPRHAASANRGTRYQPPAASSFASDGSRDQEKPDRVDACGSVLPHAHKSAAGRRLFRLWPVSGSAIPPRWRLV